MISFFPSAPEQHQHFVPDVNGATHSGNAGLSRGGGAAALRFHGAQQALCLLFSGQCILDLTACVIQYSELKDQRRSCHRPKRLTNIDLHEGRRDGRCMPLQVTA